MAKYDYLILLKVLKDNLGIEKEEALKMTSLDIRSLLLAHQFTLEAARKKAEPPKPQPKSSTRLKRGKVA